MERPSTRREAKAIGSSRYFTGIPCQRGHIAERMTANKRCVSCQRAAQNALNSRPAAKAARREYDRRRWVSDRDYFEAKNRRYYAENTDRVNAQKRDYWASNRERMAEAARVWRLVNPHVHRELAGRRRAALARAIPAWADMAAIRAIYAEAVRLTNDTGIAHHVDHIVPLQGANVCGLHVQNNLPAPTLA